MGIFEWVFKKKKKVIFNNKDLVLVAKLKQKADIHTQEEVYYPRYQNTTPGTSGEK